VTKGFSRTGITSLALILAPVGGCGDTPQAPVLRDDPVYQNDREGIRFLIPEGWQQRIRGEVGPGKAVREWPLVEYRPTKAGEGPGSFRVSRTDLPPSADLAALVSAPSHSVEKWVPTGEPEEMTVGGQKAVRYSFTGRVGKVRLAKEAVAVRRGDRVYLFTVLCDPKDNEARELLRRVLGSVVWKG
jgi:hypothetical protein